MELPKIFAVKINFAPTYLSQFILDHELHELFRLGWLYGTIFRKSYKSKLPSVFFMPDGLNFIAFKTRH